MFNLTKGCLALLAGMAAGLTACASPPPPSLAQARGDVDTALTSPPGTHTQAELNEGRIKLGQAEGAANDGDMKTADRLSQEAIADVRLSRAQADAQHAQTAQQALQSTVPAPQDQGKSQASGPPTNLLPPPGGVP